MNRTLAILTTTLILYLPSMVYADLPPDLIGLDGALMALVPAGEFLYGKEKEPLTLPDFYMDKYEVTVRLYEQFMYVSGQEPPIFWNQMTSAEAQSRPVTGIDWNAAAAYCHYYKKRLPTEQEWEKSARSADGRLYPWGNMGVDNQSSLQELTPHNEFDPSLSPWAFRHGLLSPVGHHQLDRSAYGIYDLAGNVREWTDSDHESKEGKVVRGGSWFSSRQTLQVVFRSKLTPSSKNPVLGFRCAQSAAETLGIMTRGATNPDPIVVKPRVLDTDIPSFYLHPSSQLAKQILIDFNRSPFAEKDHAHPPLIGFLAAAFEQNPDYVKSILPAYLLDRVRYSVAIAYHLVGRSDMAQLMIDRFNIRGYRNIDFAKLPANLDAVSAIGLSEFDLLWGASFATGDPKYCLRILAAFAQVANVDGNAEDMVTIIKALYTRTDLKWVTDKRGPELATQLAIFSSALWGLESNARHHEFIRRAVDGYITSHQNEPAAKALEAVKTLF